jgi:replication fork clamp-binding protein CrfC
MNLEKSMGKEQEIQNVITEIIREITVLEEKVILLSSKSKDCNRKVSAAWEEIDHAMEKISMFIEDSADE